MCTPKKPIKSCKAEIKQMLARALWVKLCDGDFTAALFVAR